MTKNTECVYIISAKEIIEAAAETTRRYGVTSAGSGYAHILGDDDRTAICNKRIKAHWRYDDLGPFTICPRCAAKK